MKWWGNGRSRQDSSLNGRRFCGCRIMRREYEDGRRMRRKVGQEDIDVSDYGALKKDRMKRRHQSRRHKPTTVNHLREQCQDALYLGQVRSYIVQFERDSLRAAHYSTWNTLCIVWPTLSLVHCHYIHLLTRCVVHHMVLDLNCARPLG